MRDILLFLQNHWVLFSAVFFVMFLLMIVELLRAQRGASRLSPQLATQFMNHKNAVVIDLRPVEAFREGHILDSVSIPFSDLATKNKKLDKYKSKPLILVCANGLDSPRAATQLAKLGLNPMILAGGIRSWRDADMPLVKD